MVQILNRPSSLGELLGTGLGSGVSTGVNNLLQMKLDQMLGQKEYETLLALTGKTPTQQMPEMQGGAQAGQLQPEAQIPQTGFIKPGKALDYAKFAAEQEYRQKKLAAEEHKQQFLEQEKIQPFLHAKAQDFGNAKKLYNKAKAALTILEQNKDVWPELSGLAPDVLQPFLQRNPQVRKYLANTNELVTLLAGSRRGQPTNFKIKLEQKSKPELNQPYETQKEILKSIIKDAEDEFNVHKQIQGIKAKGGKYPRDLETQITEFELGQLDKGNEIESKAGDVIDSSDQNYLIEGQTGINEETGQKMIVKNGKWRSIS